jgi:hypothetical protein
MLTSSSSAEIIQFPAANQEPRFEAWKESWLRQVHADPELGHRAKNVATALSWYLNRESKTTFASYRRLAKDIGINERLDARDSVKELQTRGHLQKQSRGPGKSNVLAPAGVDIVPTGCGYSTHSGVGKTDSLTSLVEPPNRTCSSDGASLKKKSAGRPSPGAPKKNGNPALAFEGQVVRVTAEQLDSWRRAYPEVPDVVAELRAADDYFAEHPSKDGKWFFRASNWLKREHDRRLGAKRQADNDDDSF